MKASERIRARIAAEEAHRLRLFSIGADMAESRSYGRIEAYEEALAIVEASEREVSRERDDA